MMAAKQLVQPTTSLEYPYNHFSRGSITSAAFTDSGTDAYRRAILARPREPDGWQLFLNVEEVWQTAAET
jgi:hypothetical protein